MAKTRDMTNGNPLKHMIFFALPILLGSVFQQLYNTVDTAVVGRFVGTDQLAAVGATGSLSWFVLGFVFGLTGGYSILISQAFGAREQERIRQLIGNIIVLSGLILLIFVPFALLISRPALVMMRTPENILADSVLYISIIFGGYICTMTYNVTSAILRAMGDTKTPLYFLILSSILNILLDIFFILVCHWGVAGTAIATIMSQGVSGILCLIYAYPKYEVFHLKKENLIPDWAIIKNLLSLGLPMAFQSCLTAVGMIIMQVSINSFGSAIIASYTAAHKVEMLVSMLALSMGTTTATFVGQNAGACKSDRMFAGVRTAIMLTTGYAILTAMILVFGGKFLLGIFIDASTKNGPEILSAGMTYLKTFACFLWPYNALIVFRSALQGMGKSIYTLVGGIMECIMRIVVSLTLPAMIGYLGCCLAGPAAWVGAIIPLIGAYFYEKKRWQIL